MMAIEWGVITAVAVPAIGGALAVYHSFDKRLDKLESDCRLLTYQLEILQADTGRRGDRVKQAIYEITQWLQKRGFVPRSQTPDGPWPSPDPPTQSFLTPQDR